MKNIDDVPLISARSLEVELGTSSILRGVDVDLHARTQVALTGRSGSGKTTLLLVLAGLLPATSGLVSWPALDRDLHVRRGQIGMVFQAPSLMPELTASQNVTLPLRLRGVELGPAREAAARALERVNASDLGDALPWQLSGGQQQRIAVARVLAGRHRVVLADEPTGALDRAHAHEVVEALRDGVIDGGGSLVLATHDPELAGLFHRRLSVSEGRLHAELVSP